MDADFTVGSSTSGRPNTEIIRKSLNMNGDGGISFAPIRTGYVYDAKMMAHSEYRDNPEDMEEDYENHHPEQPNRIKKIHDKLREAGCIELMYNINARLLNQNEALLVHTEDHWEKVAAIAYMNGERIQSSKAYYEQLSLYINPETPGAALLCAGGVVNAALAVARGEVRNIFANVRPPGHHAEPDEHMGFCFFNNVAVAAKVVQQETPIRKILILDWDVHHGNGTQRAFYDDDSVLYISIHRYEDGTFYPCGPFGSMESCGEGKGLGYSVNVPWPEGGMGDADYLHAFMKIVMPIAYEFSPELVIISAGFDAAEGDDLGECEVTPAGFAHMTYMLASLAGGKLVVALEGGYNLDSIANSAVAVAKVLLGNPPPMMPELFASETGVETVWFVAKTQSRYWKCIDPKESEPKEEYGEHAISVSEILKSHRTEYMSKRFNMFAIPFADDSLEQAFTGQVLCTNNIYSREQLVVFIHDCGSLHAELDGASHLDLNVEASYLIDASQELCEWINKEKYGLLDINVYPRGIKKVGEDVAIMKDVLLYIWDNYIGLTEAVDVIFVASGIACGAMVDLIHARDVRSKVRAIVQVVGVVDPVRVLYDEELRIWYKKCSLVILPSTHPKLKDNKFHKAHDTVVSSDEERLTLVLAKSIPMIQAFVRQKLDIMDV